MHTPEPLRTVILISGRGSNMQAIHQAVLNEALPISIDAVISNQAGAAGLDYASRHGLQTIVVPHQNYPSREDFDMALMQEIDKFRPRLVILAGFMRILSAQFVNHYLGRLINIHPALLPDFPGLNTHRRALQAGVQRHGASVHYVTPEVDGGPVIVQGSVEVLVDETPESLQSRVLQIEHQIFPLAIRWIAEGKVTFENNHACFNAEPLATGGVNFNRLT